MEIRTDTSTPTSLLWFSTVNTVSVSRLTVRNLLYLLHDNRCRVVIVTKNFTRTVLTTVLWKGTDIVEAITCNRFEVTTFTVIRSPKTSPPETHRRTVPPNPEGKLCQRINHSSVWRLRISTRIFKGDWLHASSVSFPVPLTQRRPVSFPPSQNFRSKILQSAIHLTLSTSSPGAFLAAWLLALRVPVLPLRTGSDKLRNDAGTLGVRRTFSSQLYVLSAPILDDVWESLKIGSVLRSSLPVLYHLSR